ncbi:MAG: ABC transporter permease [Candidatus Latescibacteria bacterium]|mgnify:CR=1 FL=1|nr:ABC transporter permease [Candidatus Latescibacterota bacterium]
MDVVIFAGIAHAGASFALPLLLAALGEIFAERSGVVNIGLEGMMLSGALGGMIGSYFTGSAWLGLGIGMATGVFLAVIFSTAAVHFGADQIVAGTAVNILALGLTGVVYRRVFGITGSTLSVESFDAVEIPLIHDLPMVGALFSGHTPPVYIGFLLVPIAAWVLFRTTLGIKIRAVGEHPLAADTAGIRVQFIRHGCTLFSGAMAGCAGAYLSVAHANTFVEGMSAGRGFIALAIVIFGRWHPFWALGAALLFGIANALQFQFQAAGSAVPYQFFLMLPYLLTLLVLVIFASRTYPPAALARAYARR